MTKREFLDQLGERLSGLPRDDVAERLAFYDEMIDDRVEDGLTEAEAVAGIGTVDEIASQIIADTPFTKLVRERVRPRRVRKVWETVLLILGSPVWAPLLIAVFAILLSVFIVIWSVVVSILAVGASLAAGAVGGAVMGLVYIGLGDVLQGMAFIGIGLILAGLAVFFYYICVAVTRGAVILTKKTAVGIKSMLIRKDNEK